MLTDGKIKYEISTNSTYVEGLEYYRLGMVKALQYEEEDNCFYSNVKGSLRYDVFVEVDEEGEIGEYGCSCTSYSEFSGACKHIVATLKTIQGKWENYFSGYKKVALTSGTKDLLEFFNNANKEKYNSLVREVNTKIIPMFHYYLLGNTRLCWLEFSIGQERLYVLKNVRAFVDAVISGNAVPFGKNYSFDPKLAVYDKASKSILELLKNCFQDEKTLSAWGHYSYNNVSCFEERKFKLKNSDLLRFFEIMENEKFDIDVLGKLVTDSQIVVGRPDLNINVSWIENGVKTSMENNLDLHGLDKDFKYIFYNDLVYKVDKIFGDYIAPLLKCFTENKKSEILIPQSEIHGFFSGVVPSLKKVARVDLDESLSKNFYKEELQKEVYLERYAYGIAAKVKFRYGDIVINPAGVAGVYDKLSTEDDDENEDEKLSGVAEVLSGEDDKALIDSDTSIGEQGKTLIRDSMDENRILNIFDRFEFKTKNELFVQAEEEKAYDFLMEGLPKIREMAEVFYADDFKEVKIKNPGMISTSVKLNALSGFLEMKLSYENMEQGELWDLLASFRVKKKYHRLKNGNFMPLDSLDFKPVAELMEQLDISKGDLAKKFIELPAFRALYIDSLAREHKELNIERSSHFKKMVQDISEPQDMEFELPEGITGKLREYQKIGFKWFKTLTAYGFGGILADDMGLGKTLQVLTFIMSEKDVEKLPCLAIVPTSLVYNWQAEVDKFAPSLKVVLLSGSQIERREKIKEIMDADLVVTSYGMVKRDIEFYADIQFKYCFLDEAQHIKNPNTLNAKSVKKIRAKGFFAITGTPVENTLTELWSIFDYLMPGYLHTHHRFVTRYETPIVKSGDEGVIKELGRHIKPFILRRMKKDVLKELPEKIESKMTCEMTEEQKKVYLAYLMKARKEFVDEVSSRGFDNSRIKILSILTRLRQICCHPALFIENYTDGSGKLDMLMELLEDAVDSGHRILVFSQFTSMLSIIKNELHKTKYTYFYLDGSTPSRERISLVNDFNEGKKDIFLISLKAGGTGLNLTGADMVVHFDPWWNPAVEDQATDRAYRIGQKNAVQAFKMITKDTIEEKIYELQQKKKALIDSLIQPGENFITKMSEDEIRGLFDMD